MGFNSTPPPPAAPIPVATESNEPETAAAYQGQNARRKGLLSSILTTRRGQEGTPASQPAAGTNRTLG